MQSAQPSWVGALTERRCDGPGHTAQQSPELCPQRQLHFLEILRAKKSWKDIIFIRFLKWPREGK